MSLSSPDVHGFGSLPGRPEDGLYPISVVTELTGIGAHTLRGYERAGLLRPEVWPFLIVYGAWLWRVGLGMGAAWLGGHQPELLAALSPRRAA